MTSVSVHDAMRETNSQQKYIFVKVVSDLFTATGGDVQNIWMAGCMD